ncbi:uncharacterized protein PODANS_4_3655 [Podospora anserina S mat+]|uniref:Podospora anserina S mat+ genomic DNA chromosome 4, supercontig 4 n=1 Tax=Podospora anserina (strain S / ATCC MYA-4624 / DSM 980 / FGSC 10383) TaxID=515849 RepID=B2AQN2_PODAN|nr:uncharacterized protein PODANS_4_3655 [Podospora anserina S mat+]CAP66459.1 unnamed protein product [Podospora anserina S mat+]CDP28187.1 Putative protein of unknown function [Podospora anserina S mat+]
MLQDGGGVIRISHNTEEDSTVTIHLDLTKFASHGKPAPGRYLLHLHIWRCAPNFSARKDLYEPLCAVEGEFETETQMELYEASNRGWIQSWAEMDV